jgi:2-C-methyl-D-erythritol 4-phosphate cytidylyltransferase
VPLAGLPILGHAMRGVLSCADVAEVVVVAPASHLDEARTVVTDAEHWSRRAVPVCREPEGRDPVTIVSGGSERSDSVAAGLAHLSAAVDVVLVHDAARCLTPVAVFERVIAAVEHGAVAVVPGTHVVDTIKVVDEAGAVLDTPQRSALRAVQTPQGFRRDVLERAHAAYNAANGPVFNTASLRAPATAYTDVTDDAGLVERLGERVLVVEGDARALKVTTRADLETAERLLATS